MTVDEMEIGGQSLMVISFPTPGGMENSAESLSVAERHVARLAAEGLSNAEVARVRGTSLRTVANQMASVLRKLGVDSRRQLMVLYARGRGLSGPSS